MLGRVSFDIKTCMGSWLGASEMTKRWTSVGRNAWEFVDCFSLVVRRLRKITRQFNVPSALCVGVLAMWVWLECDALVGLCELLARSKLA